MITLKDVQIAKERIAPYILHTPLIRVPALDPIAGCQVYLKLDCTQITGSFKLRGALNCMLALSDEERAKGVTAPSSGNHAQALAYAAKMLGCSAKIVMPDNCNPVKLERTRSYGAEVVLVPVKERENETKRIVETEGRTLVHAFDDPRVKAGQGTIGLEILEDEPDIDVVIAPLGGGGLISGIAAAVKGIKPNARVYAVENEASARWTNIRKAGKVVVLENLGETIADGTRGNHGCEESWEMIQALVDDVLVTNDEWLIKALNAQATYGHVLAEPSSCMPFATAMQGILPVKPEDKVAFVLSGGNYDMSLISRLLHEQNA